MSDCKEKEELVESLLKLQITTLVDTVRDQADPRIRPDIPTHSQVSEMFDTEMKNSKARAAELANYSIPQLKDLFRESTDRLNQRRQEFDSALDTKNEQIIMGALENKQEEMKVNHSITCMIKAKEEEAPKQPQGTKPPQESGCVVS